MARNSNVCKPLPVCRRKKGAFSSGTMSRAGDGPGSLSRCERALRAYSRVINDLRLRRSKPLAKGCRCANAYGGTCTHTYIHIYTHSIRRPSPTLSRGRKPPRDVSATHVYTCIRRRFRVPRLIDRQFSDFVGRHRISPPICSNFPRPCSPPNPSSHRPTLFVRAVCMHASRAHDPLKFRTPRPRLIGYYHVNYANVPGTFVTHETTILYFFNTSSPANV